MMDRGQEVSLTKTNLFEARTAGYWNYRIPGLLCAGKGVVLATTEARRGQGGDWDGNDVLIRRSLDDGVTWEPSRLLVGCEQYGPGPVSNCVMIRDEQAGAVHALYCHNYARVFYMQSKDAGASFSTPTEITRQLEAFRVAYPWRVIATGPGHGIQLRGGRLVVPLWMSTGEGTEFGPGRLGHRPSASSLITSDDHGVTWQCADIVAHTSALLRHPSEGAAVELRDGRVLLNMRSESDPHQRLIAISPDGIRGWSEPFFDSALLDPQCMASLIRLDPATEAGSRILFANPDNLERTLPGLWSNAYDRKRLTVKMSYDECQSWVASRVLEEGPAGYSDLAVATDGTILCFYECGFIERMSDTRYLTLARFKPEWLEMNR
jgi:sialidase-1